MSSIFDIFSQFSAIQSSEVNEKHAEYGINRNSSETGKLYLIYFAKDGLGIWRIHSL